MDGDLYDIRNYMTTDQAARDLGVNRRVLCHQIKVGRVRAYRLGKSYLIHRGEVDRIKKERPKPDYIQASTLARYLGIARSTLCQWIQIDLDPEIEEREIYYNDNGCQYLSPIAVKALRDIGANKKIGRPRNHNENCIAR